MTTTTVRRAYRIACGSGSITVDIARTIDDDNPIMKESRELEARLQRAVTKYEDAQEVRRTYEQIVKRLKEERIGFNNQLEAREATMRAKEADYEELLLMSHDANQSKEMAKQAPRRPRRPPLPPPS